ARDEDRAAPGQFGGTPTFMAPEQLDAMPAGRRALNEVGPAADLFALGVILYELLAGEHPFGPFSPGMNLAELRLYLLNRQARPPRPLRQFTRRVEPDLVCLVEQCLAVNPAERPASAAAVVAALEPIAARLRRRRQGRARRPWLVLGGLASVLAAGALAGGGGFFCGKAAAAGGPPPQAGGAVPQGGYTRP